MNPYDTTTVTGYITGTLIASLLIGLIGLIFAIIIYWRIFSKAGYSGARSLLMFIPLVNLIIIIMFAFSEWPIQRELNQLRQAAGGRPGGFPPQYPPQGPQFQQAGQYPQPLQYGQPQGSQFQQPPQYGQPQYGQPQGPQSGQDPQQR
jgi:hypothetical protein